MDSRDMLFAMKKSSRGLSSLLLSSLSLSSSLPVASMTSTSSASSTAYEKAPVEWRVSLASSSMEGFAPGYKSANQDSFIALPSYGGNPGSILLGVFDGHGRAGHHVSRFLREKLPATLLAMIRDPNHNDHPFLDAFENLNLRMSTAVEDSAPNNSCRTPSGMGSSRDGVKKCGGICGACKPKCGFDAYNSGSTAVVSHIDSSTSSLVTAWTGDSRAVLGMMIQPNSKVTDPLNAVVTWRAVDLSNDHKPDRPDERRRIALTGGRVAPSRGKNGEAEGPARVWLPDQEYPGLAMSRAMGDLAARPAGIICAPDSSRVNLNTLLVRGSDRRRGGGQKVRDHAASIFSGMVGRRNPLAGMEGSIWPGRCFVVLASDGVFEFMSSQEVVDVVARRLVWTRLPGSYVTEQELKEGAGGEEGKSSSDSSSSSLSFPSWGSIFGQKPAHSLKSSASSTGVTGAQADAACDEACRAVVRESLARWKKEYGGRYIDDITVCIAQLESIE